MHEVLLCKLCNVSHLLLVPVIAVATVCGVVLLLLIVVIAVVVVLIIRNRSYHKDESLIK